MADENVPAPAPTRSDDQILPYDAWVPIGKSNYLDESWFTLDANLLREALEITHIDPAHLFVSPPSGKTSGHDRPRYLVLQMLWGIITYTNVDFAELMWEEFVQAIQTFLTDKANLGSPTKKGRKDKPHVIPYCRLTKLIICHLGRIHNIHQRSASLFHLAEQDLRLGNLKFVSKGEADEVFGMSIPNELISNNIQNAPYYTTQAIEKSSKPVPAPKPKVTKEKPSKASTAKPPNPKTAKEKSTKDTPLQKAGNGKVTKVRTMKSTFQLVDEPDEEPAYSEPEPEPEYQGEEPVIEATRPLPVVEGKGKAIVTKEQAAQSLLTLHTPKRRSTTDQFILQRRTPTTEEASTRPFTQLLDDTSANIVHDSLSPVDTEIGAGSDKTSSGGDTEAGSDPGETHESQPLPDQAHMNEDRDGPDPGISRVALAGPDPEPTHDEFMADLYPKNLENAYAIGDQFINDKSSDDEPGKLNVEAKVVSMVIVSIYQSSSSVPPLSTLLAERVAGLEKKLSDLEQTNKNLDNITQNLRSRVYTLELRDLPHKIDEAVRENVKEARDEFLAENDKSRKQRRDDQDPYPPPPDSDISKRRRHDTGASGSSQPSAPHPHDEQPVKDIPIPDSANISDSEDTDSAHLLKIKQKIEWLKHIPPSHIPDAVNKWANALATTYQALA
ncbi:hypothetical protein Tco_1205895 [Tanacetum coccineum]